MKRLILEELKAWKSDPKRKPLIIKGARQVGKTYILEHFGKTEFKQTHYFNFEKKPHLCELFEGDLDPTRIINALSFQLNTQIDIQHDLIIFDEIQACPKALTSLKYFSEDLPEAYVCCAGSLLGIYLGPVSYPVGKVDHMHMYPMTFLEFLMALDEKMSVELLSNLKPNTNIPSTTHHYLWEKLKEYFIVGGLPEVIDIYRHHRKEMYTACELARKKQRELIDDYYSDIAKHAGKINAMHIARLFENIPEQLGQSQAGSAKKYRFKGAIPGIDRFSKLAPAIDWLENAGLIHKVSIVNQAKQPLKSYTQANTFKLFLFDVGILGALSDLHPKTIIEYDYGSYKGYFAENYIAQAFCAAGHEHLYSWTNKTSEVEFLRQIKGEIVPIEVKSGNVTKAKSLQVYCEKYQPAYRTIMSGKSLMLDTKGDVHHYPLYLASFFPIKD